ncbi:hypothetical protein LOTGIDRAFT_234800 [Lottia gigantea]|uniref:WD repeat-containing protein 74 n=1 Tax=Lottia gigantea TaxID=225164 RepID=V4BHG0_LOTGI|nr:hypothetical protein LOTGIDRAFT_234800 [Lottia gigantea]ESO88034.1 hypothetical protein LOTGIDRAFT_234800 [Lottia gigantea]
MAASVYSMLVGSETGLLKGIDVNRSTWNNLNSVQCADRSKEILAMCWEGSSQQNLYYGLRNREIHTFDFVNNEEKIGSRIELSGGTGPLKGLSRINDNYITAVESGLVKVWNGKYDVESFEAGDKLCCMVHNTHNENLIAAGGDENDLKIWDLQNLQKPIFMAKNVRNDWLNLRVPVKVLGAQFVPNSQEIVTCTGYHQVRLYDPRTPQRRPVVDMSFDEYPLMAIGICHTQSDQVVVGNTQGKTALLDFRKGRVVHKYKGFAGSVRSIQCHPTMPLVVTCGLDRFVRIHHIVSRELMHKFYLKSRLNCLLLHKNWKCESLDEGIDMTEDDGVNETKVENETMTAEDDLEEDIWNQLEVVTPRGNNYKSKRKDYKDKIKNFMMRNKQW